MPHRLRPALEHVLVRKGLKFSHLRLIVALADLGQVGAAAQSLGMTQPGASRLLAELESLTGAKLYERHARGIRLTRAGQLLAGRARKILSDLDMSAMELEEAEQGLRGTVRIGSVTGPSLELLLPLIKIARVRFPEIDIAVEVETSHSLNELLMSDALDFYIGRIPDDVDPGPYRFRPIGVEPISLIVRLDHPLARRPDVSLAECLDYDWVTQPPGGILRRTAEDYLLSQGLPVPTRVLSTSSTLFTLSIVNDTNAIAPLATAVADFFIERGALGSRLAKLPVAPDLAVKTFGLVQLAQASLNPAAARLCAMLLEMRGGPGGLGV